MIENIEAIIALVVALVGLFGTVVTLIAKLKGSKKLLDFAEKFTKVSNEVIKYIEEAEELLNFTGLEKKQWVVHKIKLFAESIGFPIDESMIENLIETAITFSKKVNKRIETK